MSGKISKILLDQGMGYWRGRMPYRDQMGFDFNASLMNRRCRWSKTFICSDAAKWGVADLCKLLDKLRHPDGNNPRLGGN